MVRLIREADVQRLLPMPAAIDAVEGAFQALADDPAANRPRQRVRLPAGLLHVMPAALLSAGFAAVKAYTSVRGQPTRFHVLLWDAATGALRAIIEADRLGQIRTGAASGVATRYLTPPGARRLGVIGTGWQARSQVAAIAHVRPLSEVRVFGRDPERRATFCRELSSTIGVEVRPVAQAHEAVEGAEIVVTATSAREPVIAASWLAPRVLVNAIGANQLARRELDADTIRQAALIVVDSREQARQEAGDLAPLLHENDGEGSLQWSSIVELAQVVTGRVARPETGITIFKSLGLAIEDVAAAAIVYRAALESGIGEQLRL